MGAIFLLGVTERLVGLVAPVDFSPSTGASLVLGSGVTPGGLDTSEGLKGGGSSSLVLAVEFPKRSGTEVSVDSLVTGGLAQVRSDITG